MKCRRRTSERVLVALIAGAAVAFVWPAQASAAAFQNLDFESAVVGTAAPITLLPASQALPGWTSNNWDSGQVLYDGTAFDSVCTSLHDGRGIGQPQPSRDFHPLQGAYSLMLQDGETAENVNVAVDAYVCQTGDIPGYARSLMFSTDMAYYVDHLQVSLGGTVIPMHLYSVGSVVNHPSGPWFGPVETFIGDISTVAGQQDVELRFTKLVQDPSNPYNHGFADIDAIQFSTIVVPEPSSLVLLAIGILSLAGYCWRRRNRAT